MPSYEPEIESDHKGNPYLPANKAVQFAEEGHNNWNFWFKKMNYPKIISDFSGHDFTKNPVDFSNFIFHGPVNFSNCRFSNANFRNAEFRSGDANFSGAEFYGGNTDFSSVEFSGGEVLFDDVKFCGGQVTFVQAKFNGGYANFERAQFTGGDAKFWKTSFTDTALFIKATFHHNADFSQANFESASVFKNASFKHVPDFRYSHMKVHFSLHGMEVGFNRRKTIKCCKIFPCKIAPTRDDVDKFRRLKELAANSKDHEREQDFFAKELMSKRFYEQKNFLALLLSFLYEKISDFGRSISIPGMFFLNIWLWWSLLFYICSTATTATIEHGLRLSASVMMPFSASAKAAFTESKKALFGDPANLGFLFDATVIFQGLLSLICVFLIGLALRNRFRI